MPTAHCSRSISKMNRIYFFLPLNISKCILFGLLLFVLSNRTHDTFTSSHSHIKLTELLLRRLPPHSIQWKKGMNQNGHDWSKKLDEFFIFIVLSVFHFPISVPHSPRKTNRLQIDSTIYQMNGVFFSHCRCYNPGVAIKGNIVTTSLLPKNEYTSTFHSAILTTHL